MPDAPDARYVVLRHVAPASSARPLHWDLMLECGNSLRTWALLAEPTADTPIAAQSLPNHRLTYLAYEGPIDGDRGEVSRWDAGQFVVEQETDDQLVIRLRGAKLSGRATLQGSGQNDQRWTFSLVADST